MPRATSKGPARAAQAELARLMASIALTDELELEIEEACSALPASATSGNADRCSLQRAGAGSHPCAVGRLGQHSRHLGREPRAVRVQPEIVAVVAA